MKTFYPGASHMPESQDKRESPKKIILLVLFMAIAAIAFADSVHLFNEVSSEASVVVANGLMLFGN
jgi:hypothetical protein